VLTIPPGIELLGIFPSILGRATMAFRLLSAAALLLVAPALAQASDPKTTLNVSNWDVFQKLYPPRALAAHEEGSVGFLVTLDSKGAVTSCQVTHSSGHPLLDEETCKIITMNAQFKPDPGLSPSQTRTSEGMIAWKLPASTTALASPKPVTLADAPEKVICKKSVRTGTLAGFERTCMTQRQWDRQSDETKQVWDEIQGRKGSTKGN
jgi:TonB family protein